MDNKINGNVSTAISQLMKNGESIIRVRKGVYKTEKKEIKSGVDMKEFNIDNMLQYCTDLDKKLINKLSYELSDEEFSNLKKLYEENKRYMQYIKAIIH